MAFSEAIRFWVYVDIQQREQQQEIALICRSHMELDLINSVFPPVNVALDTLDTRGVIEFQMHLL